MNKATFYAAAGALVGYLRTKAKTKRMMGAAKGAALAWLVATQVAPRIGLNLPVPSGFQG